MLTLDQLKLNKNTIVIGDWKIEPMVNYQIHSCKHPEVEWCAMHTKFEGGDENNPSEYDLKSMEDAIKLVILYETARGNYHE